MMKIFSDKKYLPDGKNPPIILYPFWGKPPEDPIDPNCGRFDEYIRIGAELFQMTSIDEADVVIIPIPWAFALYDDKLMDLAMQLVEEANIAKKKVVIFFLSDMDEAVPIKNSVIFRTSIYRSKRKNNEFAMPAWSQDFVKKYFNGQLPIRKKLAEPVVGFCGYAAPLKKSIRYRARNILRWGAYHLKIGKSNVVPSKKGIVIRTKAMRILEKSHLVKTNFIIRDKFIGGAFSADGTEDLVFKQKIRMEYVQNMVGSDYILCVRGDGNYSYRLYETLSCGRIPIFIDTDCVLPYDFDIKWKKYCIWLDESEIHLIAEKVAEFHNNISDSDFIKLQHECRSLWKKWLSPEGFFSNFHRHFQAT